MKMKMKKKLATVALLAGMSFAALDASAAVARGLGKYGQLDGMMGYLLDNSHASILTGIEAVNTAYTDHIAGKPTSDTAPNHIIIGLTETENPYIQQMYRSAIAPVAAGDSAYPGGHLCVRFASAQDATTFGATKTPPGLLPTDFPIKFGTIRLAIIPVFGNSGGAAKAKVKGTEVGTATWDRMITGYEVITNFDEVAKNVAGHGKGTGGDLIRTTASTPVGGRSRLATVTAHNLYQNARFLDTATLEAAGLCPDA